MRQTYMAKPNETERRWIVLDATDIPLGRLSTVAATFLRGKNKPTFTPNVDTGDSVIIINAEKVRLTGKKATDKKYYRHSGHPGGIKVTSAGVMREEKPERLVENSIRGMLPHNSLGRLQMKHLHVYAGSEHNHAAQKPEVVDINELL
ncbi:MAG: 50S ribosomal protein L13 [Aerococcus sp.]|nr:50S ribosomal protein L13 [Aerococcus sp.]